MESLTAADVAAGLPGGPAGIGIRDEESGLVVRRCTDRVTRAFKARDVAVLIATACRKGLFWDAGVRPGDRAWHS